MGLLNPLSNIHDFKVDRDIGDLSDKIIVVTGGNAGIGKETVLQLAKHKPRCIYLTARTRQKYEEAMVDIEKVAPDASIKFLELDLASLASVSAAANTITSECDRLDILVNNAGVMALPHAVTQDGYEIQFGTNHMGHFLFTRLLLPLLEKTAALQPGSDARIVTVSSSAHMMPPSKGIVFDRLETNIANINPAFLYGQTKLANILFTRELARRYPTILSVAVHPGRVTTNLDARMPFWNSLFQKSFDFLAGPFTVQDGALCQLWACVAEKGPNLSNGSYYVPVGKENEGSNLSRDADLAKSLWTWSEDNLRQKGYLSEQK